MASPQLEHGYTRVAHELLEAIARAPLRGAQIRVLLVVIRRTFGAFGSPKMVALSLGDISKATGLGKSRVGHVVTELLAARVLLEGDVARSATGARTIGPNKDHSVWSMPVAPARPVAPVTLVAPARPVPPCVDDPVPTRATPDRSKPAPDVAPQAPRDFFETTEEKARSARGPSKPKKTPSDPRIAAFMQHYSEAFEAHFGRAPLPLAFPKLGALVRDALRALDAAGEADALGALEEMLPRYFALSRSDRFYAGAPLAKFLSTDLLQRLRASAPRAGTSPRNAQAIDLARSALAALVPLDFSNGTVDGAPCELRRDADGSVFATRNADGAGYALEEEIEAELLHSRNATPAPARAIVARRVRITAPEGAARA